MGFKRNLATNTWEAWYSRRHPKTGKPITYRRVALRTEAEARRAERELVAKVVNRIEALTVPAWSTAVGEYLRACERRGLTRRTVENAESCLKATTFPKWGARKVTAITTDEIRALLFDDMAQRSPSYRKSVLKLIRGTMSVAVEQGILANNPAPTMTWHKATKLGRVLTEEQIRRFLHEARDHGWQWYPHCAVSLYTGLRNGELFALRWEKVNLANRQALIDTSWNAQDGFKCTKSGDDRIIDLAPAVVPLLERLKLQTYQTGFVLPRLDDWEKGHQAKALRTFLVGIGLPPIRFHDLRATWATLMMSKGVAPIKVMIMGGWKELKTMQIYMRKAGVEIKGIADCLEFHSDTPRSAQVISFPTLTG